MKFCDETMRAVGSPRLETHDCAGNTALTVFSVFVTVFKRLMKQRGTNSWVNSRRRRMK